jgi:hypothetical protein
MTSLQRDVFTIPVSCPAHFLTLRIQPTNSFFTRRTRMKVLFINNDGGGFADYIEVSEGTTIAVLFQQRMPHGKPQDYLIRVNRQPVGADCVLQPQDRVSFTPNKIQGA